MVCMPGLPEFLAWLNKEGIGKVAVTNAPRCFAEFDGSLTCTFSQISYVQ